MKNVLIIGASSDCGKQIAKKFASKNFNLILASRDQNKLIEIKNDILKKNKVKCQVLNFDICNHDFNSFFQQLETKPDILISTIGINQEKKIFDQDEFYNVINTNYVKLVLFIENIIQKYHHSDQYLSIIVFSSIAGERGRSYNYIYGSSKSALTQYLSGLRQKYNSSNINIITIIPGYIKTKMLKNKNTNIFLTTSTNKIADIVYNAYTKKKDVVYTPFWFFISVLIKIIPEFIYKKLKF